MNVYETQLNHELLEKLISLSVDWEGEDSTYGYRRNERGDVEGNRIFLAEQEGEIFGYLFGQEAKSERATSIMADGTVYFEIEELYVTPEWRNQGVGRALFTFVERELKAAGIEYMMLSTATKNYKKILHFYIEELGMDFWSARLFKKL